jgi:hypothetical protein
MLVKKRPPPLDKGLRLRKRQHGKRLISRGRPPSPPFLLIQQQRPLLPHDRRDESSGRHSMNLPVPSNPGFGPFMGLYCSLVPENVGPVSPLSFACVPAWASACPARPEAWCAYRCRRTQRSPPPMPNHLRPPDRPGAVVSRWPCPWSRLPVRPYYNAAIWTRGVFQTGRASCPADQAGSGCQEQPEHTERGIGEGLQAAVHSRGRSPARLIRGPIRRPPPPVTLRAIV